MARKKKELEVQSYDEKISEVNAIYKLCWPDKASAAKKIKQSFSSEEAIKTFLEQFYTENKPCVEDEIIDYLDKDNIKEQFEDNSWGIANSKLAYAHAAKSLK